MKVKNIKSFIDFYKSLGITNCISKHPRNTLKNNSVEKKLKITKKNQVNVTTKTSSQYKFSELEKLVNNLDCNLKDIATNTVLYDGEKKSEIMLIGDTPGTEEDRVGKPFIGQAGKLLDKMFSFIGLDRKKDFYVTNLIFWRPPGNRIANEEEIKTCLPITKIHIKIIKPKMLIFLGNIATKALINTQEGVTKLRGKELTYLDKELDLKIPARAIFHPNYLLRNPIENKKVWKDLIQIHKYINEIKIGS